MDKKYEAAFMREHDLQVTKLIHRILILTMFWFPGLVLADHYKIINFPLWMSITIGVISIVGWILTDILIRMKKIEAAKILQLIYLMLLVMGAAASASTNLSMLVFAAAMMSCIYADWKLTTGMCIATFLTQFVVLIPKSYSAVEMGFYPTFMDAYSIYAVSNGLEVILLTIIVIAVVRNERDIFISYFDSQKEMVSVEATSQAKTGFLANMSHEIRTPINAIIGMDEMILRESREIGVIRYATNIKNASKTLLGIINDILDFSKVESGKMEIVEASYSVSSLLNDFVTMIQTRADNAGLTLKLDIDERIPSELIGDEVRLRQIITNLLTNAVKYTDSGSVTLRLRSTRLADDEVMLDVAVNDTGIGIAKDDIEKLWESFSRVNEEHNHGIEGTGLGLPLTKQLIELMGSTLNVNSVVGEGSSFYFSLKQKIGDISPLGDYKKMYELALEKRSAYRESFTAPQAHILVVDDTKMNLEVVKGLLKKTHIKIDTSLSGPDAIELVKTRKYDIIFLDHKMPGMDGVETLEHIKALPENPNEDTKIVALTANAISGAKEFYMERGFNDYLSKPIQGELLEQLILDYLPPSLIEDSVAEEEEISYISELRMPDIDGIDTDEALAYCSGSHKEGIESLRLYYAEFEEKYEALAKAYDEDDWNMYQIIAHAIKSTSRTVGAIDMSDFAKIMEDAAAASDEMMIETQHGVFITQYKNLNDRIKAALDSLPVIEIAGQKLEVITEEEIRTLLDSIVSGANSFDVDAINDGVERLANVDIVASLKTNLKNSADNFDYDGVSEKAKALLAILDM